jgi:hypothetical protein
MSQQENDEYDPYCKICSGCGESGCCSPLSCEQHPEGHYCRGYLRDLQFGYRMFKDLFNLIDTNGDEDMKKSLDEIYDKNYDLTFKNIEDENN